MSEFTRTEIAETIASAAAILGADPDAPISHLSDPDRWSEVVGVELAILELGDSPWASVLTDAVRARDWDALHSMANHLMTERTPK